MKKPFAILFPSPIPHSKQFEEKKAKTSLDKELLVERTCLCRSEFSRIFHSVSIKTGKEFDINCHSWRCPKHREKWGRKWSTTIGEQLKVTPVTLLVNLTTSEMVSHEQAATALRFFFRRFRNQFGKTEYVKVVEYNKKHTQPHFHLLFICDELKIPELPKFYTTKEGKKLSFPEDVWAVILDFWAEALDFAAPLNRPTFEVWCQPPVNSQAAASYAVGYITGKSQKNEEPDATWRGRKLSYSRGFFYIPASQIWSDFLAQLFPDKDPEDQFFWKIKPIEMLHPELGDNPLRYSNCVIMVKREKLAQYYASFGEFPTDKTGLPIFQDVGFDFADNGQEIFVLKE